MDKIVLYLMGMVLLSSCANAPGYYPQPKHRPMCPSYLIPLCDDRGCICVDRNDIDRAMQGIIRGTPTY